MKRREFIALFSGGAAVVLYLASKFRPPEGEEVVVLMNRTSAKGGDPNVEISSNE
jgi:hypothetical protein